MTQPLPLTWLEPSYEEIRIAGTPLKRRNVINFPAGVTGVDNPTTGATDLTISATISAPATLTGSTDVPQLTIYWNQSGPQTNPIIEVFSSVLALALILTDGGDLAVSGKVVGTEFDRPSSGVLALGATNATRVDVGNVSAKTKALGGLQVATLGAGVAHLDASGNVSSSSIVDADVSSSAAIAYSKLHLAASITDGDVSPSAGITYNKLNLAASVVNADIASGAAIAYSKLALTGGIVNSDVNASAAIAYSKLALSGSIVNADVNASAAIAGTKISPNFGSQVVQTTGAVSGDSFTATTYLASGSSPASSGLLRLSNSSGIYANSHTPGTNIFLIGMNGSASDSVQVGDSSNAANIVLNASTSARVNIAGTTYVTVNAQTLPGVSTLGTSAILNFPYYANNTTGSLIGFYSTTQATEINLIGLFDDGVSTHDLVIIGDTHIATMVTVMSTTGAWSIANGANTYFKVDVNAATTSIRSAATEMAQASSLGFYSRWKTRATLTATTLTLGATDYVVPVDSSSGGANAAVTVTTESSPLSGTFHFVTDVGNAAATNNITLSLGGGKTFVDGSTSMLINRNGGGIAVSYNGTTWSVLWIY